MSDAPTPRTVGAVAPSRPWHAGLVAFALAAVSALTVAMMGLPDEPAHAVHAAAVVRGEAIGADAVRTDTTTGWTRTETAVTVPSAYAALPAMPVCFAFEPQVPAGCAPPVAEAEGTATTATTTVGTYAPPWYAAVGWPSLVLDPPAALLAMRLVAAALFAVLVGVAVASARRAGGGRWTGAGLVLALPPVAVHLAGGINPSGTEIAGAVALWTSSAAVARGATAPADLVRWAAAGAVVAVSRPLGPALALGIPAMTLLVLRPAARRPWRDPAVARTGVAVVLVALAALGWSAWRGTLSAFSGFPAPEATGLAAVRRSLSLVPERVTELVGVLGWSDVALPRPLVAGWLLAVAAVVVLALWTADRRARTWLVVLGVVVLVLPVAADLRSAPTIGFVWQGRYTLPVAAGLPILAGLLLDGRAPLSAQVRRVPGVLVVGALVAHGVAFLGVLVRFRVGTGGALGGALAERGGPADLPGWVLMSGAVAVLAAAVAGVAPWVRATGEPEGPG